MSKVLPLLALLAASPAALAGTGWEIVVTPDGSKPTARHEAAYVEFEGKFYLMGGRGPRPVDEFDPVSETWKSLGNPPLQMHHFQPVVHDGLVWVVCAFEGDYPNETPVPNVWTYHPPTNDWQMGPPVPPARNRGAAGAVVHDGAIYVVGGNTQGHNGGYVPWLDRYDPATDTWTALADAPHARDHFTAAAIGNKLYAGGGRQTTQPNPFVGTIGPVDVYDFTSGLWGSMPQPIPTERAGTMTVARDEHLIVIGGETATMAHDETEALDVGTGEWITLPPLVVERHSGGAVLHEDVAYVASGAGNNGGGPELNTQERLELTGLLGESAANLAKNGDFDAGLAQWTDEGDLTLNPAVGGIREPALDVENGSVTSVRPVPAYETYTLTGVYQAFGATGELVAAMEYLDNSGAVVGTDELALAPATAFTSFRLKGTTPDGTRTLRLRFLAGGDRLLRIDDVVLVETPAEVARLGVPANPWALQPSAGGAVIGQVYTPSIDHTDFAPAATLDVLALGFAPVNAPGPLGTVLLGLVSPFFLQAVPGSPFLLPIPLDTNLVGLTLHVQGASVEAGGASITNALEVTLQKP